AGARDTDARQAGRGSRSRCAGAPPRGQARAEAARAEQDGRDPRERAEVDARRRHAAGGRQARGAEVVSRVADLLARGVRITVGLPAGTPAEIPAEFFEGETRTPLRSEVPLEVDEFEPVYAEAAVPAPLRGYGIDKMVEILESKRLAALPREVRIAAVMASLEAAGVPLQQVVKDAALRERALSGFVSAKER